MLSKIQAALPRPFTARSAEPPATQAYERTQQDTLTPAPAGMPTTAVPASGPLPPAPGIARTPHATGPVEATEATLPAAAAPRGLARRLAAGVMGCLRGVLHGLQAGAAAVRDGVWRAWCWLRGADEDGDVFYPCREDLDMPEPADDGPVAPAGGATPASVATLPEVTGSVKVTGITPLHFTGSTEIAAPLLDVAAVIFDRERADWVPNYQSSRVLARLPDNTVRGYMSLKAAGRKTDVVTDTQLRRLPAEALSGARSGILCAIKNVPASSAPNQAPAPGHQRVGALKGRFVLRALAPNRTHVTYEVGADAGVRVPAWIIKLVAGNQAKQTLAQLTKRVAEPGSNRLKPELEAMFGPGL